MPNRFRSLVVCDDDDFREELVERAMSVGFSVRSARGPGDLPRLLRRYGFDWLILDLGLGEDVCLQTVELLAGQHVRPRTLLVGESAPAVADHVRRAAAQGGLEPVGLLRRPLSLPKLRQLLGSLPPREGNLLDLDPSLGHVETIPSEEIVVHYQPIVAMTDRTLRRAEALVRWQHPQHGLIRPVRFISMFERADSITPLTWEVLSRAIDQQVAWKRSGLTLAVSVNISALFLASLKTADDILALLQEKNGEPRHLMLEITETEAAINPPVARALLSRLREAGVEVSMDDYGVGFSDLERLRYYPFSDLKVDRWLVAKLDAGGREGHDIVTMLVALARREQFSLTGEGIETEQQWKELEHLGCDYGQGFLLARPMPADQLTGWVDRMAARGRYYRAPGDHT
ncbi:MAG: EAL domain-containing response regulator [Alphaproteobacteria bacterium]|nr:EAL domain-containing response regulator [Alphaproteobacteria bacterium]MBV8407666.1 EAL domain-containing response regulator [Alphaproteobacteria bacterium]